jgi:hypothetical protein
MLKDKCKCGSSQFEVIAETRVYFDLDDGTLTPTSEENLGYDGNYHCCECDKEYQARDFDEIL